MKRSASLLGLFALAAVPGHSRPGPGADRIDSRHRQGPVGSRSSRRDRRGAYRCSAARQTVTDDSGIYRFPALRPGTYEITATLQGFKVAKRTEAVVELGKTLTMDMVLQLASIAEEVSVTTESSPHHRRQEQRSVSRRSADRPSTACRRGATSRRSCARRRARSRESQGGGTQIDGASGSENRYIIDGIDTTNLQTGTSGKTMLLDFIEEVQVKSSGYNAEFGGATGGVVNVVTKSGRNALPRTTSAPTIRPTTTMATCGRSHVSIRSTRTSPKPAC